MSFRHTTAMLWNSIVAMLFAAFFSIANAPAQSAPRNSTGTDELILATVKATREALLELVAKTNRTVQPVFLTFWDFDGTILNGDCSEGFKEDGREIYPGLAEVGINRRLSALYPPPDGYKRFSEDYHYLEKHVGRWLAYPFIGQAFRGAKLQSIHDMASQHFQATLRHHYFKSSVTILKEFKRIGIDVHILTASSDFFVEPAAATLELPAAHVHGIEFRVTNGIVTEEIIYPVTFAEGKAVKLREIVSTTERLHSARPVFVLAAFGNSFETDGPFLKFVAEQKLPAGKPLSVMINGGKTPLAYQGLFLEVERSETVK